eukprot:1160499-Pelagomonas_calceolata.AAC.11
MTFSIKPDPPQTHTKGNAQMHHAHKAGTPRVQQNSTPLHHTCSWPASRPCCYTAHPRTPLNSGQQITGRHCEQLTLAHPTTSLSHASQPKASLASSPNLT